MIIFLEIQHEVSYLQISFCLSRGSNLFPVHMGFVICFLWNSSKSTLMPILVSRRIASSPNI